MRGTVTTVNRALLRPILIAGVEKRLLLVNCIICFPMVAVTHFHFPACLIGSMLFGVFHVLLRQINKHDADVGKLIKRATRYLRRTYYPPISHPCHVARAVKTLG